MAHKPAKPSPPPPFYPPPPPTPPPPPHTHTHTHTHTQYSTYCERGIKTVTRLLLLFSALSLPPLLEGLSECAAKCKPKHRTESAPLSFCAFVFDCVGGAGERGKEGHIYAKVCLVAGTLQQNIVSLRKSPVSARDKQHKSVVERQRHVSIAGLSFQIRRNRGEGRCLCACSCLDAEYACRVWAIAAHTAKSAGRMLVEPSL